MDSIKIYENRPYVILSGAITLDGQIASIEGDVNLSNSEDWIRVHKLRAENDAIMVGGGTIRVDNSKLTIDFKKIGHQPKKNPIRVVVSATGNIPEDARVITYRPEIMTIIAITSKCSFNKRESLRKNGCEILHCGDGELVNLPKLLNILKTRYQVNKLMLEGGSRLNAEMLSQKLIDEVQLAIAPVIVGKGIPLFNLSKAITHLSNSPFFEIKEFKKLHDMLWIRFIVHYESREIL